MFRVLAMSLEHARRTVSEGLAAKKLRPEAPCPACKHTMEWVHIDSAGTKEGRTGTSTNAIAVPCPNCGKTDLVVRVSYHFD